MRNNGILLPLIASIGVGAATFYSMRKNNNKGMAQTGVARTMKKITGKEIPTMNFI